MRLLGNLRQINDQQYKEKTDKIVGRMSIGNIGRGHTVPAKCWSDCYNPTVKFIRPPVRLPAFPRSRLLLLAGLQLHRKASSYAGF